MFRFERKKSILNKVVLSAERNTISFSSHSDLLHGWVLPSNLSSESLHEARRAAQIFSDTVVRPSLALYSGCMQGTWRYFGNKQKLLRRIEKHIAHCPDELKPTVVCGPDLFRTFIYAKFANNRSNLDHIHELKKNIQIKIADNQDFMFRQFCNALQWNQWLSAARDFLYCLQIPISESNLVAVSLGQMVERFCDLRFDSPALVPPTLPLDDIERRFGHTCAQLWSHWANESHSAPLPPLKNIAEGMKALDFETQIFEIEPWSAAHAMTLFELPQIFHETFFRCLSKIIPYSNQSTLFGIKDFKFIIDFDNKQNWSRHVSLNFPIFLKDKHAENILATVVATLPKHPLEIQSADDPSYFISVNRIENLTIIPTQLYEKRSLQVGLFDEAFGQNDMQFTLERLVVKNVGRVTLGKNLQTQSAESPSQMLEVVAEKRTFAIQQGSLYRYCQSLRPHFRLNQPEKFVWNSATEKSLGILKLQFLETIDNYDYYKLNLKIGAIAFWLRAPAVERTAELRTRNYVCLGIFEES